MEIMEIIKQRHSVRQYLNQKIEMDKRVVLNNMIEEINNESGLDIQILYDEPNCFSSFMAHYGSFSNVCNYIAIVGKKGEDEQAGYYGEKLVLECQKIGLNTCWVAVTHGSTKAVTKKGEKVLIVISLGYGENQGIPHKSKALEELCTFDEKPDWFMQAMEAVCLAPTAMNQQKFRFQLKNGKVTAVPLLAFYSKIDLGIAKYHFEAVSGHEVE